MANKSASTEDKFGFLDTRKKPATTEPIDKTAQAPSKPAPTVPAISKEPKALAKTKDPAWKGYTFLVKIDTHADASAILRKRRKGEDMSDLAEQLLAEWVEKNK